MPKTKLGESVKERKKDRQEARTPVQLWGTMFAGEMDTLGVTHKELAARIGVSPSTVNNYRKAPGRIPFETIVKIKEALNISDARMCGVFQSYDVELGELRARISDLQEEYGRLRAMMEGGVT